MCTRSHSLWEKCRKEVTNQIEKIKKKQEEEKKGKPKKSKQNVLKVERKHEFEMGSD